MEPQTERGLYTHDGEELLYILEGEFDVRLASGQRYRLRAGESLFYPSTIEHEWSNATSAKRAPPVDGDPPTW